MDIPPAPERTPLLLPGQALVTREWKQWLDRLIRLVNRVTHRVGSQVNLTGQTAAIATTTIAQPAALSAGLYRISYAARVTTAATTSSSLTVTLGWTHSSTSITEAGPALTDNSTAVGQSRSFLARIDQGTNVTYATAYSSSGATAMAYQLDVWLEQVK